MRVGKVIPEDHRNSRRLRRCKRCGHRDRSRKRHSLRGQRGVHGRRQWKLVRPEGSGHANQLCSTTIRVFV